MHLVVVALLRPTSKKGVLSVPTLPAHVPAPALLHSTNCLFQQLLALGHREQAELVPGHKSGSAAPHASSVLSSALTAGSSPPAG